MRPALDQRIAKKRIRRFFDEPLDERMAVSRFLGEVAVCADVFVFGGALRDISLWGVPRFSSDVDIVLQVNDVDALVDILGRYGASQNKFGGYRVRLSRWNFDVWEVSKTWAFSVGAVELQSHLSLLETTFFNWDAILYDYRSGALHYRKDYFSNLSSRYLDLVLEENPNAAGAFVRALRMLSLSDEIITGPRLSNFIKNGLDNMSDENILALEKQSFSANRLSVGFVSEVRDRALDWRPGNFKWLQTRQFSLFDEVAS